MSHPFGIFRTSLQGHKVYCPVHLPPKIVYSSQVIKLAEDATHLLGQVAMCRDLLPNSGILIKSSLMREAIASSTIEGTVASPEELMLYDLGQLQNDRTKETQNYRKALELGVRTVVKEEHPISLNLILDLHSQLMDGVRGHEKRGRWKDQQNFIAPHHGAKPEEISFTPVCPEDTAAYLDNLEKYINLPQMESRVIQCALVHHQFESIHPFGDGNGRVGRLLIVLHLISLGLIKEPVIYPSVYFERTRDAYVQGLQDVRFKGDWNAWISYFLNGIIAQGQMTIKFVYEYKQLQAKLREAIPSVRHHASVDRVLECFFSDLLWSVPQVSTNSGLSFGAANKAIETLVSSGIIIPMTDQRRNRAFVSPQVFQLLFERNIKLPE